MTSGNIPKTARLHRMVMDKHICPYGVKSRWFLEKNGYLVDDRWLTTREQTDAFKREHKVRTTPQAFIEGQRIGGYTELRKYLGKPLPEEGATSYAPVIAVFCIAALLAMAASFHAVGSPFTVRAGRGVVHDLGTAFVVTSYPGDTVVRVVVAEGRVRVRAADGEDLGGRPVAWTSSDERVAAVDSSGRLEARAVGSATVTATVEGKVAAVSVRVVTLVARVETDPPFAAVEVGEVVQITARAFGADDVQLNRPITWESSDPAVATVNAAGRVTALSPGSAAITASSPRRMRPEKPLVCAFVTFR